MRNVPAAAPIWNQELAPEKTAPAFRNRSVKGVMARGAAALRRIGHGLEHAGKIGHGKLLAAELASVGGRERQAELVASGQDQRFFPPLGAGSRTTCAGKQGQHEQHPYP